MLSECWKMVSSCKKKGVEKFLQLEAIVSRLFLRQFLSKKKGELGVWTGSSYSFHKFYFVFFIQPSSQILTRWISPIFSGECD